MSESSTGWLSYGDAAAVNGQQRTVNEAGILGGEEGNRGSDLFGLPDASGWSASLLPA